MIVATAFVVSVTSWLLIAQLLNRLPFIKSVGGTDTLRGALMLCRPHTVKGTVLASTSGYILLCVYHGLTAHSTYGRVIISGVMANVFIVGINQLVDVEIDRVNAKDLPLATGELTWPTASRIVSLSLVVALTVAFTESVLWGLVISSMCLIGVLYSVPPFRLKRFAVPAALCIVSARALLATIGGTFVYTHALGKDMDDFSIFHMKTFTLVLVGFTTVIALMKDVPDMEGDVKEGVKSLCVIIGPHQVSNICLFVLSSCYLGVIYGLYETSYLGTMMHIYSLVWLSARWTSNQDKMKCTKSVAMKNYFGLVWPLFYFEFFAYLVPLAYDHLHIHVDGRVLAVVLGLEVGYLLYFPEGDAWGSEKIGEEIRKTSGLDVNSIHRNLRLKGPSPSAMTDATDCVAQTGVAMSVAINMHAKLTRLTGKSYRDAKKLAILCGDWLLARAVIGLCGTKNHDAIHEMGKAIAAATSVKEEEITNTVMQHTRKAQHHVSRTIS